MRYNGHMGDAAELKRARAAYEVGDLAANYLRAQMTRIAEQTNEDKPIV